MSKLKLTISRRLSNKKVRKQKAFAQKKVCRFEASADYRANLDYKNVEFLRGFITERGKILPSRVSGNSVYYQRKLAREIKLARSMALLPYCPMHR